MCLHGKLKKTAAVPQLPRKTAVCRRFFVCHFSSNLKILNHLLPTYYFSKKIPLVFAFDTILKKFKTKFFPFKTSHFPSPPLLSLVVSEILRKNKNLTSLHYKISWYQYNDLLVYENYQGPPKGKQVKSENKDDNSELKKFRDNCKIVFLFPDLDSKKVM